MKRLLPLLFILYAPLLFAEDGYRLWLRYDPVSVQHRLQYTKQIRFPVVTGNSPTAQICRGELCAALSGLLNITATCSSYPQANTTLLAGTTARLASLQPASLKGIDTAALGAEGFALVSQPIQGRQVLIITANTDIGMLYGVYHFIQLLQTEQSINSLHILSVPKIKKRLLNHWDNLNRTVERGYAGFSIWNWHTLPAYIDQRYVDYARANASIGINGTVLTNVNANATVLTRPWLEKVKALADVFRPYGIKVYLTARFNAPVEIAGLPDADPLNNNVRQWWQQKAAEIYKLIPDFGGFLVKANSEGQPGPQAYGRNHADGANMLAEALEPYGGLVIWRAFVYSNDNPEDRHKQAYHEFVPLDGQFKSNVLVQVKNGAIDFMPREPFHPLFGAMPKTPLAMEFQVTQEYLGQATHLVYLGPLMKECLDSDTYSQGAGSTVANIIDGSINKHALTAMAGVANIGNDINWCGHPFAQANWYALGRLAWDHSLSAAQIADEWLRRSFTNDTAFVQPIKTVMLRSREILVNYMNPLGLHHIMGTGHHYGPAPWVSNLNRPEWNPVYYHQADSIGIGFNRTATGSNALSQYFPQVQKRWADSNTCEDKYLLWFHHMPWTHTMQSGRNLWNELCYQYYHGVDEARWMRSEWRKQKGRIDEQRYQAVSMLLDIQITEAQWWRDACLLYFKTFSKMPLPAGYEAPQQTLDYFKSLRFPFALGNG